MNDEQRAYLRKLENVTRADEGDGWLWIAAAFFALVASLVLA